MSNSTLTKKSAAHGQHLRAFLWLRWRLRINQAKRGGIANVVIMAFLAVLALVSAAVLFFVFLAVALYQVNDAEPAELMFVLDGMVVAFLFLWATGLLTELQRSEALSLEKFLHLPVSLTSAFLINYLSSLPSMSSLWFVSAMLGLSFGLVFSRGLAMLWLLPMLASFLLMVTALTYQFQGWLAALMANPRRRRTIVVVATMIVILLSQVPNLVNMLYFGGGNMQRMKGQWQLTMRLNEERSETAMRQNEERSEATLEFNRSLFRKGEEDRLVAREDYRRRIEQISREYEARIQELEKEYESRKRELEEHGSQQVEETAKLLNVLLPPGWLPAGVEAIAEGRPWPIVLAILGPALIGTASLCRAYRTTMRLYTGQYTSGTDRAVAASPLAPARNVGMRCRSRFLERKLPWLSEQATAITLAAFRSLLRAPEAKMLLLSPILLLLVFGSMSLASGRADMPEGIRPLLGFGAMVMVLFSMSQLLGNQFGFDRDGFRVFVLSPARRRDILLGKNLAVAPIAMVLGAAAAAFVQVVYPMRLDRFLALAPQFVSMYLLYCLAANSLSILVPMRIAPSSFQPAKPSALVILSQLLFMFFFPAVLGLTLLPLIIELVVEEMGGRYGLPIDLLLSLLECAAIVGIYGLLLGLQGDWLQAREQRILQLVTTRTE